MYLQEEALKLDKSQLFSKSNNLSSLIRTKYEFYYMRKVLVSFILVTLLSLLLSYFTGLSYLHSYTYYSSTSMIPYLTQTFERKYMFLLCNGILVFLAGRSGFHRTSSCSNLPSNLQMEVADTHDNFHENTINVEEDHMLQPEEPIHPLSEEEEEEATEVAVTEKENVLNEAEEEIETENEEERGLINVKEEEGDTESEGPGSNTEELNKKIEEFIRKMKEELQLQAQQQHLIAA